MSALSHTPCAIPVIQYFRVNSRGTTIQSGIAVAGQNDKDNKHWTATTYI